METVGKTMTVVEVLEDVRETLGDIEVPASKIEQIGLPIARSINGIQMCIDAMNREDAIRESAKNAVEAGESTDAGEAEDNA